MTLKEAWESAKHGEWVIYVGCEPYSRIKKDEDYRNNCFIDARWPWGKVVSMRAIVSNDWHVGERMVEVCCEGKSRKIPYEDAKRLKLI